MSETLDWMFELDGDTSGADRLLKTLDSLDKRLAGVDRKLLGVEKGSERAGGAHKKQGHEVDGLGGAFKRLIEQAIDPFLHKAKEVAEFEFIREGAEKLLELPERLAEGVKDLGEEMVKAGAKAERTGKVFENIFGAKPGRENLEFVEKIAKDTEFTVARLKEADLQLAKVGFKGEDLDRGIAAALDMAARSGGGEAGLSEALSSLERLKRTGRVSDRTLGGIGAGENDFFAEMTKRTGKGRKTLKKEMDEGTLDTKDAIETLYAMIGKATGKDLGGEGVAMSKLMGAKLTHLGEVPDRLMEKAKDSAGWENLTTSLGKLGEQLGPEGVLGKQIGEGVVGLFDRLGPVLDKLPDQVDRLSHAFDGFGKVVDVAWHQGERMVTVLEAMSKFAGRMVGAPAPQAGPDKSLLGRVATPGGTLDKILMAPDRASSWIAKKLFGIGENGGDGLADGLRAKKEDVAGAGADMSNAAPDASRKALGVHSPSVVFEDIGAMTSLGFVKGLKKGHGSVDEAVNSIFDRDGFNRSASDVASVATPSHGARASAVHVGGVTVTVQVHGSGNAVADAETIGERLKAILPGALISAFEQSAIEVGGGSRE